MKYSLLIALLIAGIASFFGYERQQKIKSLTTELETLVEQGEELDIPTDPTVSFSPRRAAQRAHKRAREEMVQDFIGELMTLIKESQKPGMQNDPKIQERGMKLIATMLDLSPAELKMMVLKVSQDPTLKKQEKQQLTMFAIMMLANDNPNTALTLILESKGTDLDSGQMGQHMLSMALGSLAKTDPIAAAEWLKENGEKVGGAQDNLTRAIITQTALQNVGLALDLIKDLAAESKATAYSSIGASITAERVDEFFNAIRGHDATDAEKASAFRSLASGPFVKDPASAIAWLDKTELSNEERSAFKQGLHYYQIKDHAETWMNWLVAQPNDSASAGAPEPKSETTQNIIRNWTREDFVAAGEWVGKLPPGDERNAVVESYAETLSQHEPEAAEAWAVTLPEGSERNGLLNTIHRNLRSKDQEAAAAFAKKHGIDIPAPTVKEE
ncbi:hypothetical protein N9A94_05940 [Akkermansiaceae bacterium]|nr:hypothetical protein [Akkermansiaceae bacterium]MDB4538165.1 hypothetical protein [Akkermansiaceae bacterium]